MSAGKGDAPRPIADRKHYAAEIERIFGHNKKQDQKKASRNSKSQD